MAALNGKQVTGSDPIQKELTIERKHFKGGKL